MRYVYTVLLIVFVAIIVAGVYLVIDSHEVQKQVAEDSGSQIEIAVSVEKDKVTVDITTEIPGIVFFCFGMVGLLLLLIRVPLPSTSGTTHFGTDVTTTIDTRRTPALFLLLGIKYD